MGNIIVEILHDKILISELLFIEEETSQLNLSGKKIVLNDKIIRENKEQLKKHLNAQNKTTIEVSNFSLIKFALILINNNPQYKTLIINENDTLDVENSVLLLNENVKLTTIECYKISEEIKRLFENKGVEIITTSDLVFKKLEKDNGLFHHSYQITVDTTKEPEKLTELIKGNEDIKIIDIKDYEYNNLEKLLKILKTTDREDIVINLYDTDGNIINNVNELKKLKKKYKTKIRIIYSEENIKSAKLSPVVKSIIVIFLSAIIIGTILYLLSFPYNSHKTKQLENKVKDYKVQITENIAEAEVEERSNTEETKKTISQLKEINPETVGWLTVKNTNIDYPVVKHNDNSYYLNHDFENNYNPYGWVFMDYRNNDNVGDKNTIIYGHDSGGVTFSNLYKVLYKSWYTNQDNRIIEYNTQEDNGQWEIFSIYKINTTSDYLEINFTDETYKEFIKKITNRSIYNFKTEVTTSDKILTLSTCYGNSQRLVVHAKKIN